MPAATLAAATPQLAIVGPTRVGKRTLALALGATPGASRHDAFSWRGLPLCVTSKPQQLAHLVNNNNDSSSVAIVVVFDLTCKASFDAALTQWSFVTRASSSNSMARAVLVGTKLDLPHDREVSDADTVLAAETHFGGAYVEVSAVQSPFTGVNDVERLLCAWTSSNSTSKLRRTTSKSDNAAIASALSLPQTITLSSKRRPRVHASVWLYDPTEDEHDGHHAHAPVDVKLQPIARALFAIRGAAQDKLQAAAKVRDREASKLFQRSRYYGPTESSRHMRWHEEQKRIAAATKQPLIVRNDRPRSANHSVDVARAHAQLATKSFVQPTELLRQRTLELLAKRALRATSRATAAGPATSRTARSLQLPPPPLQQRTPKQLPASALQPQARTQKLRAPSSAPLRSVPEEARCDNDDAAAVASQCCASTVLLDDDAVDDEPPVETTSTDWAIDSSASSDDDCDVVCPLPVPPPLVTSTSKRCPSLGAADVAIAAEEHEPLVAAAMPTTTVDSVNDVVDECTTTRDVIATPQSSVVAVATADAVVATDAFDCCADIDDMLDYFDGVTLPL